MIQNPNFHEHSWEECPVLRKETSWEDAEHNGKQLESCNSTEVFAIFK